MNSPPIIGGVCVAESLGLCAVFGFLSSPFLYRYIVCSYPIYVFEIVVLFFFDTGKLLTMKLQWFVVAKSKSKFQTF